MLSFSYLFDVCLCVSDLLLWFVVFWLPWSFVAYCVLLYGRFYVFFFFSSRSRHPRCLSDWSSDVCSSDLPPLRCARGWRRLAHALLPRDVATLDLRALGAARLHRELNAQERRCQHTQRTQALPRFRLVADVRMTRQERFIRLRLDAPARRLQPLLKTLRALEHPDLYLHEALSRRRNAGKVRGWAIARRGANHEEMMKQKGEAFGLRRLVAASRASRRSAVAEFLLGFPCHTKRRPVAAIQESSQEPRRAWPPSLGIKAG